MTVAFFKLQVAGNDIILIDRERSGHEELVSRPDLMPLLASQILDRRRGVGGNAVAFAGGSAAPGSLPLRVYSPDGTEKNSGGGDAFLCAARWAFDSGRSSGSVVTFSTPRGDRELRVLDSRSFSLEFASPTTFRGDRQETVRREDGRQARLELILDGVASSAYLLKLDRRYAVGFAGGTGGKPSRLKEALASAVPGAVPVVAKRQGRDIVRFAAAAGEDRLESAAAAACAAMLAGFAEEETVAEWRGCGAAASYADFGSPRHGKTGASGSLLDRGRFFIDWKRPERILVAGTAEYAFDGNFDLYA